MAEEPGRNATVIALIVSCTAFMQSLDGTVIVTALPQMAERFGVAPVELSIGITAYLMTAAIFVPMSAWVADRYGARSVFAAAVAIFTFASALCGMSHTLFEFTASRVLQGIGGSLMLPVGQSILLRGTAKRDLVRAITIATTPGLVAPVIGPPLGGFLTTYVGWPWIFYLNLPIGLAGFVLILRCLPNPHGDRDRPFDGTGLVLNAAAVGLLIYGLSRIGTEEGGWQGTAWHGPAAIILLGLGLTAAAVRHALVSPHPIVPLAPLRVRSFTVTTATGGTALRLQVRILPFLIPLMFQLGFGMSAFAAGALFLSHTAGDLVLKTLTTQILRRFGFRRVCLVSIVLFGASIAACGLFTAGTPYWVLVAVLAVSGAFRSPLFTAITTLCYADIPPDEISGATALTNMLGQLTGALGVSLAALLLNVTVALRGGQVGHPGVGDFQIALVVSGLIALSALLPFRTLHPDSGAEVSGHRRRVPAEAAAADAE